jgi:hypothetical protein
MNPLRTLIYSELLSKTATKDLKDLN